MSSTTASQEELKAHRVPLAWRDQCSAYVVTFYSHALAVSLTRYMLAKPTRIIFHLLPGIVLAIWWIPRFYARSLLLPLNVCRKEKYYLPWECENERHAYEKYVLSL
jgi:NADH:quinone oxidoreductase NDUFB7/B18 subunit-like protein